LIAAIEAQAASAGEAPKRPAPELQAVEDRPGGEGPISPAAREERPRSVVAIPSGRGKLLGFGVVAAAALVGLSFVGLRLLGPDGEGQPDVQVAEVLSGSIVAIAQAGESSGAGVQVRPLDGAPFAAAVAGAVLEPGATVRTDERTRAVITLSEGTKVTLNHSTELTLTASAPRSLRLTGGELVADVAHLADGPRALFETPMGRVEVLGTKLQLTAGEDSTVVRVLRGAVLAHAELGAPVHVSAGQEGILDRDGPASVEPAVNLAARVGWSEFDDSPTAGAAIVGLGELRARRPGEAEDQERPLFLAEHKVQVRIVGNVARTEIEQTFRNDGDHTLEGIYSFPLPADAQIASLALEVDGEWERGAFVSRDRGQQIWRGVIRNATPETERQRNEEFIWVPGPWRDPALLEWQQGGQFQLRIFPIPAHGARRIRLSYTQTIGPAGRGRRYVYPLPHTADASLKVGRFEANVRIAGVDPEAPPGGGAYPMERSTEGTGTRLAFAATDFLPAGDLTIDYRLPNEDSELRSWTYRGTATVPPAAQSREGEPEVVEAQREFHEDRRPYVLFALRPDIPVVERPESRDYVLVIDSSQSMTGERWQRASQLASRLVADMDRRDRFSVLACDATCRAFDDAPGQPSVRAARRLEGWLGAIRPAGASDLVEALREGARAAGAARDDRRSVHVIYLGDGMSTAGYRRASSVAAEVRPLAADPQIRVSTVGIGGDADALVLRAVARAGGGHHVPYVPGERLGSAALAILETTFGASLEDVSLRMPEGVVDVVPRELPAIRAGEEILVVGRLTTNEVRGEVVLTGRVGDESFEDRHPVTLTATTSEGNAFVPRLWAGKTIEELEFAGKADGRATIVALSKAFGVMSRHTSLLVLESEAMFRAFGVDRARPSVEWSGEEEMVVGDSGGNEEVAGNRLRGLLGAAGGNTSNFRSVLGARGMTMGSASSGGLSAIARGSASGGNRLGGHDRLRPQVRSATPRVSGSLSRDQTQRVIRAHTNAIRACYERSLQRDPGLQGRVTIQWRIAASGAVASARVASSTLRNSAAESCIVRRIQRMRFPRPAGGGSVTVSYPFIFATNASGRSADIASAPQPPPPPNRRGGQFMRRERYFVGSIRTGDAPGSADRRRVEAAEAALRENPDSRDRHRALARALSRAGRIDEALASVQQWIERDERDPEALTLLADLVGREGERARAIRLLSGVVDLAPDNIVLQERLARAFARAGMPARACSHRVALAEIQSEDAEAVANAVRCERELGHGDAAGRWLSALADDDARTRAAELAGRPPARERVRTGGAGRALALDARWEGEVDVDLTVVTPQGTRLSWLGGRRTVRGEDGTTFGRESLGLRRASAGSYLLEVTRARADDHTPVEGTIRVRLFGESRTIPFRLDGEVRSSVARLVVERRTRIVPAR